MVHFFNKLMIQIVTAFIYEVKDMFLVKELK